MASSHSDPVPIGAPPPSWIPVRDDDEEEDAEQQRGAFGTTPSTSGSMMLNDAYSSTTAFSSDASMPQHSDFTVQISNRKQPSIQSPPTELYPSNRRLNGGNHPEPASRRSIFGQSIQQKYGGVSSRQNAGALWQPQQQESHDNEPAVMNILGAEPNIPIYRSKENGVLAPATPEQQQQGLSMINVRERMIPTNDTSSLLDQLSPPFLHHAPTNYTNYGTLLPQQQQQSPETTANYNNDNAADVEPPVVDALLLYEQPLLSPMTSPTTMKSVIPNDNNTSPTPRMSQHKQRSTLQQQNHRHRKPRVHETRHAQSLLLGLAFAAVWTPSNLMAPNLTEMAQDFNFHTDSERDLYLGSYCALAVSVCSIPVAAAIGLWTDVVPSRKWLYVGTLLGGAAAAMATAYSQTYWQLLSARWINGGFMAGSVPVAFSFLGDLFDVSERNAASSGLTAMMGTGIIVGQVYAGTTKAGWSHPFIASSVITAVLGTLCMWLVKEPVRGGKEKVLQDMLQAGTRYERKLTWSAFSHAVRNNQSNAILLWQGFFSSLPWGVIFVFLNDFLSQERGFSVPDATYLVAVFGVGCATGGILGGYWGQILMEIDRSYLPLFMAVTTVLGILPFVALLNSKFTNAHGILGLLCSGLGGLIASLPSVNVRPCLINVNPPESRGASLTTANLLINLGRGVGPSCITVIQSIGRVDRKFAFNVTLIVFWLISAIQLLFLMKTLPKDQDAMEAELASYAAHAISTANGRSVDESGSLISIEERITSFDNKAAKETLSYVRAGINELQELRSPFNCLGQVGVSSRSSYEDLADENGTEEDVSAVTRQRRDLFLQQEMMQSPSIENGDGKWTDETLFSPRTRDYNADETTPLVV